MDRASAWPGGSTSPTRHLPVHGPPVRPAGKFRAPGRMTAHAQVGSLAEGRPLTWLWKHRLLRGWTAGLGYDPLGEIAPPPPPKRVWYVSGAKGQLLEWGKKYPLKNAPWDFPGGAVVKNPPANAGDTGSSPGPGRSHMPRSN